MRVLGFGVNTFHDPAAALVIDGEIVAAAEEERFCREKHAPKRGPIEATKWCLEMAGLEPADIDVVAVPWSPSAWDGHGLRYFWKTLMRRPSRAVRVPGEARRHLRKRSAALHEYLRMAGIDPNSVKIEWVEHHLAHASSSYHCSGFDEAAVMTIDGVGEICTTLFGRAKGGVIEKTYEVLKPDSLGLFYSAMTDYLGFGPWDAGKTMGMAPFGDADQVDLSDFVTQHGPEYETNTQFVQRGRRDQWNGRFFSPAVVERFGPPREGDELDAPYVHVAAATQKVFEDTAVRLLEHHLTDELQRHGTLVYAGGCALNITLNRRLIDHPLIDRLWIQPAASDCGLALGAATFVSAQRGARVVPQKTAALGPSFTADEVRVVLESRELPWFPVDDAPTAAAALLAEGIPIGWFEGRMEHGPRALGQRSILGHPGLVGMSDEINQAIKFREPWRPFCPSVLEEYASDIFDTDHPCPYMNLSFDVRPEWQTRIAEVVHVDGSARPQFVSAETQPQYHALIDAFRELTDLPCVLNTSLNRRGEPLVCRPEEALTLLRESGLEVLVIEGHVVAKEERLDEVREIIEAEWE